ECPAELLLAQRIAHRVHDGPGGNTIWRNLPQLLDADRVELRRAVLVQRKGPDDRLRQIAPDAVSENRDLRVNVNAWLERRLSLAMFSDSAIAGANARHAFAVVQDLDSGKPGEDVDAALGLDEPPQPFHESIERDDVVAVVSERRRDDRKLQLSSSREKVHPIVMNFRCERRALGLEIWYQIRECRRIENRARQHVRGDLARLFKDSDGERFATFLFLQLGQPE